MPHRQTRLTDALAGRYEIQYELGTGGMAEVYLARRVADDRLVAIKVLKPDLSASLGPKRFAQEISIASNLSHPNVVPVLDSGVTDGFMYFVMPFLEGDALRDRLDREKQLSVEETLHIAADVAAGLDYAHTRGFVHRDIKPENILFSEGRAVITDFGLARALGTIERGTGMTATGVAVGTTGYMSPEQAAGSATLDGRSDVYGLACLVYEMLGGEPPFTGATPQIIYTKQIRSDPLPLATVRPNITQPFDAAIARALSPTPDGRFRTAAEFLDALTVAAGGGEDRATVQMAAQPTQALRVTRRGGLAAIAAAIAIAAAASVITVTQAGRAPAPAESDRAMVVYPFRTVGPDADGLGATIAALLTASLGGGSTIEVADTVAAWQSLRTPDGLRVPDLTEALSAAERAGAGTLLLGTVTGTGGRLDVAARLYDTDGLTLASLRATAPTDSLGALVQRLRSEIVAVSREP